MEYSKILPIAISLIALIISIIVAFRNWWYNEISVRYTARNHYMSVLFDIDKQLISNPSLWSIYDNHSTGITKLTEATEVGKRRAFIYFHINLFEIVFNDYNKVLHLNQTDRQFWESWKTYIKQFFTRSSEARQVFKESYTQGLYIQDYVSFINKIIEEQEKTTKTI